MKKHYCINVFLSEKILDSKGFITWYTNIKKFTKIQSSDDVDFKRTLVGGKKVINRIYGVSSMSFIKGVAGKTANENNKLRTFSVLCGDSISSTPSYIQANIPWKFNKCMSKFRVGDQKLKFETL